MKYYVAYKIYVESPREFAGFAIVDVLDLELCSVFLKNLSKLVFNQEICESLRSKMQKATKKLLESSVYLAEVDKSVATLLKMSASQNSEKQNCSVDVRWVRGAGSSKTIFGDIMQCAISQFRIYVMSFYCMKKFL